MKKLLFTLCSVFTLCAVMLTGCNLVSRNDAKYYNQIVAEAGDVKVTMQELIYGYNTFGSQYSQDNKVSEESITRTLNDLIDKKLFLKHFENDDATRLTQAEKNFVLAQTYKTINDTIRSIEAEVKAENSVHEIESAQSQSDGEQKVVYEEYDEAVSFNESENAFKFNLNNQPLEKLDQTPVFAFTSLESAEIKSEARRRYFSSVRESQKSLGNNVFLNEKLLELEIDRIYKSLEESAIITKINNKYLSSSSDAISVLNDEIFDYFKKVVGSEKTFLMLKGATNTSIGSLTVSDVESLSYYAPTSVSQNFFEVVHILIPFDENYEKDIEALEKDVEAGRISESAIQTYKDNAIKNLSIKARNAETGERDGEEITPQELLDELKTKFVGLSKAEKENLFREYMYRYSSDDASTTSQKNMVIPNDEKLDTMVDEFAKESRRLDAAGEEGALSDAVITKFGAHIILYLGDVQNVADDSTEISEKNKQVILKKLYDDKLKSGTNKSAYHQIYEKIIGNINTFDSYYQERVNFEKSLIASSNKKIIIYKNRIKSLWE